MRQTTPKPEETGGQPAEQEDSEKKAKRHALRAKAIALTRAKKFKEELDKTIIVHDDEFYELLDGALEEACSMPPPNKYRQEVDPDELDIPADGIVTPALKRIMIEMGPGTAPDNIAKFVGDPIIVEEKANFETDLKLDPALIAQNQALKEQNFDHFKKYQNTHVEVNIDKILNKPEIDFGRDSSSGDDLDLQGEKV